MWTWDDAIISALSGFLCNVYKFTLCLQFRGKKKLAKKARDFLALRKELGDVRSRQEWLIRRSLIQSLLCSEECSIHEM